MTAVTANANENKGRVLYALPLLIALFASLFTHGTVAVFAFLLRGGAPGSTAGEMGSHGAGDNTVEVSVAGPAATIAPPAHSASPTPPTPPSKPTVTPPPPTASAELTQPLTPPAPRHEDETVKPMPSVVSPPNVGGTGAEVTSGGRAPGADSPAGAGGAPNTVEGQRALLPSAMTCKDPVAGRWEALKYNPLWGDWVRFTLVVHDSSGALQGTITSRTWSGGPLDSSPPFCGPDSFDITVQMNARGRVDASRIAFGASAYTVTSIRCPSNSLDYSPDNFSGTIDPRRQEFQSVNNDGARDIDQPYVFRRTGCIDE